jgi:O-antigen/teichoic acid export membrane protein
MNVLYSLASQVGARGSILIAGVLTASGLGPVDFASYSYLHLSSNVLSTIAVFGSGIAAMRYFARLQVAATAEEVGRVVAMFLLTATICVVVIAAIYLLPVNVLKLTGHVSREMLAVMVAVASGAAVLTNAAFGLERFRLVAILTVAAGIFTIAGAIAGTWFQEIRVALWAASLAPGIPMLGVAPVVWRQLRVADGNALVPPSREMLSEVVKYCFPILLTSLLISGGTWGVGRALLMQSSGEYEFAAFAIGLQWFAAVLLLPNVITRVFQPRIVRRAAGLSRGDHVQNPLTSNLYSSLIPVIVVLLSMLLLRRELLALYGPELSAADPVLIIFMVAAALASPAAVIGTAITSAGGQHTWLRIVSIWTIVLALSAAAMHGWGAAGAASAFCFAYAAIAPLYVVAAKRMGLYGG